MHKQRFPVGRKQKPRKTSPSLNRRAIPPQPFLPSPGRGSWLGRLPLIVPFLFILIPTSGVLSGCYILKQGTILLSYHSRAEGVEALLAKEDLEPETRAFLRQVREIRAFAEKELGLESNDNYTRYVPIDQPHLAYVVSAADKVSFTPYEWSFPIVGKVPYKGFFREADARKEAENLRGKDWDVWVRPVDAFSTLGYFSDPLYSFMRSYPIHQLAELLIHEQAHATLYVKGESQFNEDFATFVGKEGCRLYLRWRFGETSPEYAQFLAQQKDQKTYIREIRKLVRMLEELYGTPLSREEKLRRKEELIKAFQREFLEHYPERFQSNAYKGFARLPVNNAYLYLFRLYYPEKDFFPSVYQSLNNDFSLFIQVAKRVRGRKGDPYRLFEEEARSLSGSPGGTSISPAERDVSAPEKGTACPNSFR